MYVVVSGLILASTVICQPPHIKNQIGLWEPAIFPSSGIGNNIIFRPDGSYVFTITVLVDSRYDIKGGFLFEAKNLKESVSYEKGVRIEITEKGYTAFPKGRKKITFNRISKEKSDSIIGEYTYRHYTGAIAYEQFTKNGLHRLRIPMSQDYGCYLINGNEITFDLGNNGVPAVVRYKIMSEKLTLISESENNMYNFVTEGAWYKTDKIDYLSSH